MKKLFLVFAVAGIFALSSCKKCQTCTGFGDSEEVCESDFDSKQEYKAAIKLFEAFGGKCK
jgi:hypothetical protein